jgi:hypothetical protein
MMFFVSSLFLAGVSIFLTTLNALTADDWLLKPRLQEFHAFWILAGRIRGWFQLYLLCVVYVLRIWLPRVDTDTIKRDYLSTVEHSNGVSTWKLAYSTILLVLRSTRGPKWDIPLDIYFERPY